MRVELRREASRDLEESAWFYERQAHGLGDHFLDSLHQDLALLSKIGGVHEVVWGFHRKLAAKFPFAVYYQVRESLIDVVAILDCRLDPEKIEQRLTNVVP